MCLCNVVVAHGWNVTTTTNQSFPGPGLDSKTTLACTRQPAWQPGTSREYVTSNWHGAEGDSHQPFVRSGWDWDVNWCCNLQVTSTSRWGGSFSGARGAAGGYFLALESSACSAWSESNSQKQETGRREQSFQVTVWALTLHQYGNICLLSVWCFQFSLWKGEGKVVQCFVTSKLIILITKNIYLFITCMTLEISEWEDFILNQNRLLNKADCGECLSWKMFGEQGQACGDSQPCPWLLTPHRRAARHITWGAETKLYFTF